MTFKIVEIPYTEREDDLEESKGDQQQQRREQRWLETLV
jgi:hypothetical protein